jgi:N-acetylmuramidase
MLTDEDYARAAARIGCDEAAVRAVARVESRGSGFNPDGSAVTLFEGHKFHRFTAGRFSASHPTISYPRWTREHYGKDWRQEQERLLLAISLDRDAALKSASWGRFQIMGFNHGACGFADVEAFVDAMRESEGRQLDAFVELIEEWGLADELRDHRWADFARKYNGPAYAENRYDSKLAQAWSSFSPHAA